MKTTTHGRLQRNQTASSMSMKESQDDALNRDMTHQAPTSPIRSIGHGFHQGSILKDRRELNMKHRSRAKEHAEPGEKDTGLGRQRRNEGVP